MALRLTQRRRDDLDPDLDGLLDQTVAELGTAVAELRQIAHGLRPSSLDDGLHAALVALTQHVPIPVDLRRRSRSRCPTTSTITVYYVASEAIANAVKHAQATRIDVRVTRRNGHVEVRVADDGCGGARVAPGSGLAGLSDRVTAIGGRLALASEERARHDRRGGGAVRIVIGEDSALFREGLARLLADAGHEIVAKAGDAPSLEAAVHEHHPDVAMIDIRMPPDHDDDGARAPRRLRAAYPRLGILLLSQHIETRHSVELVSRGGFGYLLKDRVLDVDDFLDALARVAAGGSALDPEVVGPPAAPAPAGRGAGAAHAARARGAGPDGGGAHERGDREAARAQRAHRRDARRQRPRQAEPPQRRGRPPPRAGRRRLPARSAPRLRAGSGPCATARGSATRCWPC